MGKQIREAYGEALLEVAKDDPRIVVLDADVGNSTRSILFGQAVPSRYFNVGIAEANMLGMTAGFAAAGKIPFVNTFAVFATLRAADPLRSLVSMGNLNVKVCGAYGGFSDSRDGASHQSVEDLAVARALPNMTVIVPTDAVITKKVVQAMTVYEGPTYIRFSRAAVPTIYSEDYEWTPGKAALLREGNDLTLVACGYMVHKALEAAAELEKMGIAARVIDMSTIKPLDVDILLKAAQETRGIVTIEEHSVIGGLGSAVAECLVQNHPVPMRIIGVADHYGESGDYEELLDAFGLSSPKILQTVKDFYKSIA
jgi:transketolase